jgi:AcrR family transcriptional regulator
MEAGTRELSGEKAQRIVDAMRTSVGLRGTTGSTFDHVAREAGVSRGLLHYYFGTKERLLAEVVRHDCDVRMRMLDASLAGAKTPDDVLQTMVANLEHLVEAEPELITLIFELFALSRRHEEIAVEFTELVRRTRQQLVDVLVTKEAEGAVRLGAAADEVADVLFAMADGMALRMLAEPDRDWSGPLATSFVASRALLDAR